MNCVAERVHRRVPAQRTRAHTQKTHHAHRRKKPDHAQGAVALRDTGLIILQEPRLRAASPHMMIQSFLCARMKHGAERSRSRHWGVSVRMRTQELGRTNTQGCPGRDIG
eukprot:3185054-Heterocapsa_arctica.AAC.1